MSHSACKPVQASVLGQTIDSVEDIRRIGNLVRANSLDLLQADHTLSGIDIALWDLLGRRLNEPVWKLLGYKHSYPKMPYASVLFGDTAEETLAKATRIRALGFRAAKFGWGPFGTLQVADDEIQLLAAREGILRASAALPLPSLPFTLQCLLLSRYEYGQSEILSLSMCDSFNNRPAVGPQLESQRGGLRCSNS